MKVLNVTQNDWSAFSHDNANALRSVGVYCVDAVEKLHMYGYESQGVVMSNKQILEQMDHCDIIQNMYSNLKMLRLAKLVNKPIVVWHTGTSYRVGSKALNDEFNPVVAKSILALGEFMPLGAKNPHYLVGAFDTERPAEFRQVERPYLIAHYPSNAVVKGTDFIAKEVSAIHSKRKDFNFKMSTENLIASENAKRVNECDIYIELFAPLNEGFPYGSWGITALEAAALGKIVVTCHTTERVYQSVYGRKTPFIVCNTPKEFRRKVNELLDRSPGEILELQKETRLWVEEYHSYKPSGERLKKILENV